MALYIYTATDQEVEQAQREAEEGYERDVLPEEVDPRSKDRRIRDKFIGNLGELVICRVNKWKRVYPPVDGQPDAYRPDGSTAEIKTRTRWNRELIPVKPCDFAILLHHSVKQGQHLIQVVSSYDRDYLQGRGWNIFIKEKLWRAYLEDKLIRNL